MSSISQLLTDALQHHKTGNFDQAEALYQQILQEDPDHAEALRLLGLLAQQRKDYPLALTYLQRAVLANPANPLAQYYLAHVHHQLDHYEEARAGYEETIRLKPDYVEAYNRLGVLLHTHGHLPEAVASYRQALRFRPDYASAYNNLGLALSAQGKVSEAAESFRQAVHLQPELAEAHYNLGNMLQAQGELDQALTSYERALQLRPTYINALTNLGNVLFKQGKLQEAASYYQKILEIDSHNASAHNNLGGIFHELGRLQDAATYLRGALQLQPGFFEAENNLGNLLLDQGRFDEAIDHFRRVVQLQPTFAEAYTNLGAALHYQARMDEALAHFQQALQLDPANHALRIRIATLLPVLYASVEEMHWWRRRLVEEVEALLRDNITIDPLKENIQSNFLLAYQGMNDRDVQEKIARLYIPSRQITSRVEAIEGRKIRIGFLSKYFKTHTIGQLNRGLIANLSRDEFDVSVISLGFYNDEVNQLIRDHADHYLELPENLQAASRQIEQLGLDILYFTDIGMEPLSYALASVRLAPVQCVTWGHPMTTGLPTVDYFLSSALMEEESAAEHYSETLVRLDTLTTYYYRPPSSPVLKPRDAFGLSEEAHLYICPQSLFKFHPDFDPVLGEILRLDPDGELILIRGAHAHWDELLLARFRSTMPDVADRVRFLPQQSRPNFLNLIALSEVMLDTLHFGGGNTSFEAFAVGTPVVTLPSPFLRGRITLGQYRRMGLMDCVVESPEAYIDLAVRLGTDSAYRSEIRGKILAANSILYEDITAVREMEAFFKTAVAEAYRRQQEKPAR